MQNQQFGEKAQKLLDRLSNICRKDMPLDLHATYDPSNQNLKTFYSTQAQSIIKSPESQTIFELARLEEEMSEEQQQNCHKIKDLNDEIRKLENHIRHENDSRVKINDCFINNALRVEKNLQSALENVKKLYADREKRLEQKIQAIIKSEDKILNEQVDEQDKLEEEINQMLMSAKKLSEELQTMRKNRAELEDKIYRQFNDQLKDLKTIFHKTIKNREERQLKILELLKEVYKKHADTLKKQEITRQGNEKMFLTVIEQLIDKINEA